MPPKLQGYIDLCLYITMAFVEKETLKAYL